MTIRMWFIRAQHKNSVSLLSITDYLGLNQGDENLIMETSTTFALGRYSDILSIQEMTLAAFEITQCTFCIFEFV